MHRPVLYRARAPGPRRSHSMVARACFGARNRGYAGINSAYHRVQGRGEVVKSQVSAAKWPTVGLRLGEHHTIVQAAFGGPGGGWVGIAVQQRASRHHPKRSGVVVGVGYFGSAVDDQRITARLARWP